MHNSSWFVLLTLSICLLVPAWALQPSFVLPIETTRGIRTEYSLAFMPEATVANSALIAVTFPFQFDPRALITHSGCRLQRGSSALASTPCRLTNRTFVIEAGAIAQERLTVVIGNVLNPADVEMSSNFIVSTMFKTVTVETNINFGRIPFTSAPINSGATMSVNNFQNGFVQMGSSWVFGFTLSQSYPVNTTIRFLFPEGFFTSRIQCNITGVVDPSQQTRVFPNGRVYDCLNIKSTIVQNQRIIISGVINPNYQMTFTSIQAHILQPNSLVVLQKVLMNPATPATIARKNMNVTLTIPNNYRNNTATYIFQINMDSDLQVGDYMKLSLTGNWTYFIGDSYFIQGVNRDQFNTPAFQANYSWPTTSDLMIRNFSSVLRSSQVAFYVSLRTPLTASTYTLTLSAYRRNGGLVEQYTTPVVINDTTGYIREMRLHPMIKAWKLPVGKTGPLEFTLGLMTNLPQTNVLTYGRIDIKIIPNLPLPNQTTNGVPKCYFYGNIEAKNCSYNDSNPNYTTIIAFTPIDFNFQSSEIPFMITTQGYIDPMYQGLTIDSLVKRYHFHVQFYTNLSPYPIPTEIIFSDWVADPITLTNNNFTCTTISSSQRSSDHLQCTIVTPSEVLCQPGYFHFFRIEFTATNSYYGWDSTLGYAGNSFYPDYPCVGYGTNLQAVPYIKCDLVTWTSGPYAAESGRAYVNVYGFEQLPPFSTITVQIPKIKRGWYFSSTNQLSYKIMQDTYGYQTDVITLYSQNIMVASSSYLHSSYDAYTLETPTVTLSNSIINKITSINLVNYDLQQAGVTAIVFEVDQTLFEDIGRGSNIPCGIHLCSKFNKPVQYFLVHPSRALGRYENLTFPAIVTPVYSGSFEFRFRLYASNAYVKNVRFNIAISPETLDAPTYNFSTLESQTVVYPSTNRFFTITFTTKNPLPAATSSIQLTFNNFYLLSSTYCTLSTTAPAADSKGIQCEVWVADRVVLLQNMGMVPAGTTFTVTVQMSTTTNSGTISPTISIVTYHSGTNVVDQVLNAPFSIPTLTNTNLRTFTGFAVPNPQIIERVPTRGYFGHLYLRFRPRVSNSNNIGYYLQLTFTNEFYPYSNQLNLPLSCRIDNVRLMCTYTLAPFIVTIYPVSGYIPTSSEHLINITTEFLPHNGIYHPAAQGRYLLEAKVMNDTQTAIYETVQQYVDIAPGNVQYFNVSYAHRDTSQYNIFEVNFRTGSVPVPAYNDGTSAGRIYIGFPTRDSANGNVFASNLGYASGLGTVIPCWFLSTPGYITALPGRNLTCRLRDAPFAPSFAFVEVLNFQALPANTNVRVVLGRIMNPASQQIDINFLLRISTMIVSTKQQLPIYETYYNLFFNMLTPSITPRSEPDSTSTLFQPGAKVGDYGKYMNVMPYTGAGSFSAGDWYVLEMNQEFAFNGLVSGCLAVFYQYCIVFREINWLAVKIGNTTLLPLQAVIDRMPVSIMRTNASTFTAYTFKSERFAESINYIITENYRWLQLRGSILGFSLQVMGSQDKLNINQKNVPIMVSFTTTHILNRGGTIEIRFANNATLNPNIRPHCRSAVTLGSQLQGDPTGKPTTNVQGDVGCLVQNDYSWIITSFDVLPAGSQVRVVGEVDLPTVQTATLGTGFVVTYSDTHATNVFANGRIIDYGSFSFSLEVNNRTWSLDFGPTMTRNEPLRAGFKGEFVFKHRLSSGLTGLNSASAGHIMLTFYRNNIRGAAGGFPHISTNLVCKIRRISNSERFGCDVTDSTDMSTYTRLTIKPYQNLPASVDFQFTITTQNGDANEGIDFPTQTGVYKVQIYNKYTNSYAFSVSQSLFIEVYGPDFRVLNIISTISVPNQLNFMIVEFIPSVAADANNNQFILQFPTATHNNVALFGEDLGMGYADYDNLVFDLFQSSISSMSCKVYTGQRAIRQAAKIVCSSFSANLGTASTVKFGFWVRNPTVTSGVAIPLEAYIYQPLYGRKVCWNLVESAIRVLPTSATSIVDRGNFVTSTLNRQQSGVHFDFTTRNTRIMVQNDMYILKFNFDLRMATKQAGFFKYNAGLGGSGDVIFMRNCRTVIFRVGSTNLSQTTTGATTTNARLDSRFYNPFHQLTTAESAITGYAYYMASSQGQIINYNDGFPGTLVPRQMSSPTFTVTPVHGNTNKGVREDYRFTMTYSTDTGTDMALVKAISIQFPAFATNDYTFASNQCMQHPNSVIEVDYCFIDPTTYTLWIYPVLKGSYINSNNFIVETKGLAIVNPKINPTANVNSFIIRYYTWSGSQSPVLFAASNDYCFFRQDATNIASSTITYTDTYVPTHSSVTFMREQYVEQFQPKSNAVSSRVKTPLRFVFTSMAAWNALSGSNYHTIQVQFSGFYDTETLSQQSNDLFMYVSICSLNGARIHDCSISGGWITMRFQQAIALNQEVGVEFSVVNPRNVAENGFYLKSLTPVATLPIRFLVNGGSNYYAEAQPFHTFQRQGLIYPHLGIFTASVISGTNVNSKLNYLQFTLSFARNDINGLILQIPMQTPDGIVIYSNGNLLNLPSGSQYPCSIGINVNVYCYYEAGTTNGYSRPIRIYITQFAATYSMNLRILFQNPDVVGVYPNFIFKAMGGTITAPMLMGHELMGRFQIVDPFITLPDLSFYSTASASNMQPNKPLYNLGTYYDLYIPIAQNTGEYVILQWILTSSTYGDLAEYVVDSSYINDYFIISYSSTDRRLYLVKKLGSSYAGTGSSYHRFGNLRQKHFLLNTYNVYLLRLPNMVSTTVTVDGTWMTNNRISNVYGQPQIQYLDVQRRMRGAGACWHFLSMDLVNAYSSTTFDTQPEHSRMILVFRFMANAPYGSFYSSTYCHIESGVVSNNPLQPITCELDSGNGQIIIRNIGDITSRYVKVYYFATVSSSEQGSTRVQARLYANPDCYAVSGGWAIFTGTSDNYDLHETYIAATSGYYSRYSPSPSNLAAKFQPSTYVDQSGYAQILSISGSSMTVRILRSSSDSFDNVYRFEVRLYSERLNFNGCNSVSFTSNRYSSNYRGIDSCGATNRHTWFSYSIWNPGDQVWAYWYGGDYYDFTLNFNSIGGDSTADVSLLMITASMVQYRVTQNRNTDGWPNFYCWPCPMYEDVTGLVVHSTSTAYDFTTSKQLAQSMSTSALTLQRGYQTQLQVTINNFYQSVSTSSNQFVLLHTADSPTHTNNNPFPATRYTEAAAYIDCRCVVGTSAINWATSYQAPTCVRHIVSGLSPSIAVYIDVAVGQNLRCFFPGYLTSTTTNPAYIRIDAYRMDFLYFALYVPRQYWSPYSILDARASFTGTGVSGTMGYSENTFWSTAGVSSGTRSFDVNYTTTSSISNPIYYISDYAPVPFSFCNSNYAQCRTYDSFINRRFYTVAQWSGSTSQIRLTATAYFPPSDDNSAGYYSQYWGVAIPSQTRYFNTRAGTRDNTIISPFNPGSALAATIYGSTLSGLPSGYLFSIPMSSRTLYSNQRNYGEYQGSFMRLSLSGFTSLFGCGATISNRLFSISAPLYCQVKSSSTLEIRSRQDIIITGTLYISFTTSANPNSVSYTFELFDKWVSGSDYARSLISTGSLGRAVPGGYTLVQSTLLKWRRQANREQQASSAPIRIVINNNYQYVYDTSNANNRDGIFVTYPGGIANSDKYVCYVKQYRVLQRYLYQQYQTECLYVSANKLFISSIPSHILSPNYNYEVVIYKNMNSTSMLLTLNAAAYFWAVVESAESYTSPTITYRNYALINKYQSVYPITLNSIYTLTWEASATNSLYLEFVVNVAGVTFQYFQFEFDNLGLSSFDIANGDIVPCYLSNDFQGIGGSKTLMPRCRGYVNNLNDDSPLIIRVDKFAAVATGTTWEVAFDQFSNPGLQTLFMTPINVRISFFDRTNTATYTSRFPNLYASDSVNRGVPSAISGTFSATNVARGASTIHQFSNSWPYTSNFNDISQKIVMRVNGGITCCTSFASMALSDSIGGSAYTLLWTNRVANISVYRTPSFGATTSLNIQVRNIRNPFPFEKETYDQVRRVDIIFYNSYKNTFISQLTQLDYSAFSQLSEMTINNLGSTLYGTGFSNNPGNIMTYDFYYSFSSAAMPSRQLDYTILKFTAGVQSVDRVFARYSASPNIINSVLTPKIFRDTDNAWAIKISGMGDALYSTSQQWYFQVSFFPNANTLTYTTRTFAKNGEVQFTGSSSRSLSGDGFSSTATTPALFELYQESYIDAYYTLQRKTLFATAGLTVNKLQFRFTTPYAISQVQTLNLNLPSLTSLIPQNTPNSLTCVIQPVTSVKTNLGVGLFAPCAYSTGVYTITAPISGLAVGQEYTLSIMERNQTTSKFVMPSEPIRQQVSLIYNSNLALKYGDTYVLNFRGLMNSLAVTHSTVRMNTRNFIQFTLNPSFTLYPSSLSAPVNESVIEFEFENRYFDDCLGLAAVYSGDGVTLQSGAYYSYFSPSNPSSTNARILCGQYAQSFSMTKVRITDFGTLAQGTPYTFRFPLILNPNVADIPLYYRVRLLSYANTAFAPTTTGYYEYNGLAVTVTGNGYQTVEVRTSYGTVNVQSTVPLNFNFNWSPYNVPNGGQVVYKLQNNAIGAITSLAGINVTSNTYYNYEYYPNINVCVFRKTSASANYNINLGSFPTASAVSSLKIAYIQVHHSSSTFYVGSFSGSTTSQTFTIGHVTSWTSATLAKTTGLETANSMALYTISFRHSTLQFPEGSYMIVTIPSNFDIVEDYCKQMNSNFVQGSTLTTSNLLCRKKSTQTIEIAGYNTISPNTQLSISLFLQINDATPTNYNVAATVQVFSSTGARIIAGTTSTYTLSIPSYGSTTLQLVDYMEQPLKEDTSQELDFTFTLNVNTLTNGDYIVVDFGNWTIDPALIQGKTIWKYRVGSNIYWVPSAVTLVSGNKYKIPVNGAYQMPANTPITVRVYHELPDSYDGVYFPNIQWSYLSIEAYNSANTRLQHQYIRLWIEPYEHASLTVTPVLNYLGATTLYEFVFTPNVSASVGDIISVQFPTSDGYKTSLFGSTLGRTIPTNDSFAMSCQQTVPAGVISAATDPITCELFRGSSSANPPVPTVVQIPINRAITAGTVIKFNILNIANPTDSSLAGYPVGIVVKLMNTCNRNDRNNLCTYYKSTRYVRFVTLSTAIPTQFSSYGSLTFAPNVVSATNAAHTFTGSYSVSSGDYLRIVYYPQVPIPNICSVTSGNGVCYSYPLENTIVIVATSTQTGSYSFTLGGMTNLYQSRVTELPDIQIWSASTRVITGRHLPSYWVNHITTDPVSGNVPTISFEPTLTPDYQLKFGFNNIAKITMDYLLQNSRIQMITLWAPAEITLVSSYCNATLESAASEAKPYPIRYQCTISGSTVTLTRRADFPAWTPAFINKKVIVYLKYTIVDTKYITSNNWNANTYTTTTVNTWNRVSEGNGQFNIIEYKSPYINRINFYTQAFSKRTCRTNQLCMFYGYFLPSTIRTPLQITYLTFTLPREFGYSNLTIYDACKMDEKNDDTNTVACLASRTNSDVTVKFTPSQTYLHNYKLISIDTSDQTRLFKAPAYPGTHYQMKVNVYGSRGATTDLLVESMMVNLTTVYGYSLDFTQMYVKIPKDAGQMGLFEFKFRVGVEDVLPSYENSASFRITSQIEFEFSKSFADDLGTGKGPGDEVACLAISGLTLASTGKLTCKIYPSYSTITYPKIIVTGYDRVTANTDIVIQVANLRTLPLSSNDYIKMGVALIYFDYGGVKGYIYQPTGIVVGNTTAAILPNAISSVTITEASNNFVGDLVNYTFTGSITGAFATVTVNDYIGVEFAENVFEGVFSRNSAAMCSLAAGNKCLSFGLSRLIYFKPAVDVSTAALSFSLRNVINTAYSFEYINTTFKIFTLVNNKVNAMGTGTMIKFSKPSTNISAIVTQIDSLYGGDSGINYHFEFRLNHNLPRNGLITVQFPSVYDSLFSLKSTCVLSSGFPWGCYCEIVSDYVLVIRANGNLLNPSLTYSFSVTNLTNPNLRLTNNFFTITTQSNDDIYNRLIISRSNFSCPEISVLTVKSCSTFEVVLTANNAFFQTIYDISLICPSFIKQASELKLYLSWSPNTKQDQCSSPTDSLYSYECAITNEYLFSTRLTYLQMYLKDITPQKLISLRAKITNGRIGTYQLVANVSYKGFTYLSTTSNSFFINSDTIENISSTRMTLANYPINRAYDAIYTIRIPKPTVKLATAIITDILIEVPEGIMQGREQFTCGALNQSAVENYFMLMMSKDTAAINCTLVKKTIKLSNVTALVNRLGSDQFLRLSFYRLKNSNISTTGQIFKVSYMDSSTGTGKVLASGSISFPMSVSPPPSNLQINKVNTASQKLLVNNLYTITVTTVSGADVGLNMQDRIGLMIGFPNEYKQVWSRVAVLPSVIVDFISSGGVTSSYTQVASGVNGTLIVNLNITAALLFKQIVIKLNFVNPATTINCLQSPLFSVVMLDFKKNSILAQTLGNNVDCPLFTDRLYQVNITGNAFMEAGTVYEYTVSIEKPALYLKITPQVETSAIIFDPRTITFANYTDTVRKFYVKVANGLTGRFTVNFTKQQGAVVFYNDIPQLNVTALQSTRNYSITFTPLDVKSVGRPIEIEAVLQVPNSKQFTLVYNHNCSSQYSLSPLSFKNIPAGTKTTTISITYTGSTVPPMCVINFSISSVTTNNYVLASSRLYVSASRSIDRSAGVAAMRLVIGTGFRESDSVGLAVLDRESAVIRPRFYSLEETAARANSAQFICSVSQPGVVYFGVFKIGTNRNSVLQAEIFAQNATTGVSYGSARTALNKQISTIQASLNVSGLSVQTTYLIGAYVNSSVGISDISFLTFQTKKSSNGASITLAFASIETNETIVGAFSKTLRISDQRINVLTMRTMLNSQLNSFTNTVMNTRLFVYEVVVGPNPRDDSNTPIDVLNDFRTNIQLMRKMNGFVPSFLLTYDSATREIILGLPRFRTSQEMSVPRATFQSASIEVRLWQQAIVYGVIVATPTNDLLSAQVASGFDQNNNPLVAQHRLQGLTDSSGFLSGEFTLLDANKQYKIFITAESVVPYTPRLRIPDNGVQSLTVKTGLNLNLKGNEALVIAKVKEINLELAYAVEQHISEVTNKKKTSASNTAGYSSTTWWEKQGKKRVIKTVR